MATQKAEALQASDAFVITPHDTQTVDQHAGNTQGYKFCVLYTSAGGDIKVTTAGGTDITFAAVPAGAFIPVLVKRVWATGTTTDTGIIGLVG